MRVRVLIDDVNLKDRDASLAALDAHPNIEIRLFNPFAHRGSQLLGFITDFDRVNHRMHNKLMVMDNALAIVGGRNMSDPYFEVDPESTSATSTSRRPVPSSGTCRRCSTDSGTATGRCRSRRWCDRPYSEADLRAHAQRRREDDRARGAIRIRWTRTWPTLKSELSTIIARLRLGPRARRVRRSRLDQRPERARDAHAALQRFDRLQTELLIESAYFIPLDRGVAKLKELVDRGVRVRVLTNSLASNDVLAAFAGYSSSRESLVRAGVELYELRPEPGPVRKRLFGGGSKAGLHTKAIVFDRKDVFIGSFNLDARSSAINTEAGLYVESPALAAQVIEFMNEGVDPKSASACCWTRTASSTGSPRTTARRCATTPIR